MNGLQLSVYCDEKGAKVTMMANFEIAETAKAAKLHAAIAELCKEYFEPEKSSRWFGKSE